MVVYLILNNHLKSTSYDKYLKIMNNILQLLKLKSIK